MSTENQAGSTDTAAPMSPRGAARRRLTKAGLGAAGVLWSAQSHATLKPVICASASAAMSGGLETDAGDTSCLGRSPGYWKNHEGWPCSRKRLFSAVFTCSDKIHVKYSSATLEDLVKGEKFDQYNIGMHLVATYLNVETGKINFLSVKTLIQMWNELQAMGVYQPAKGVYWNFEETKRYLEATHD